MPPKKFVKIKCSEIEFCGNFNHINLPTDKLSIISMLVVVSSVCTLSLATITTIFFILLLFIRDHDLTTSFFSTHSRGARCYKYTYKLATVAAFCLGKLKPIMC